MNSPLRLTNSFGVIDSEYQGELKIMYTNTSSEKYFVRFPTGLSKGILKPFQMTYKFNTIRIVYPMDLKM